jgi:hydroxymethylpyrimidine/phosphomethylpyrimidine kinase
MSIAGSDSSGGAGIQADLKTFAAFGVYGTSVITAITAQNTQGVTGMLEIPKDLVRAQIDAVISDIGANAVKTGMLPSVELITLVADTIKSLDLQNIVVDPVMVAKGGDRLLKEDAIETLRTKLLPLATIITPNIPEAETLTGIEISNLEDSSNAAKMIVNMGAASVIVKGGHLVDNEAIDLFYDGKNFRKFRSPRIETKNTHGTGCTFSSAIAAGLARGLKLTDAIGGAKEYVTEAIRTNLNIGHGHGPLNHFYRLQDT